MNRRREWARAFGWHRRLLAGGLAAAAVAFALEAAEPSPPETVAVLAAADDLAPGTVVRSRDVVETALPVDSVPAGALTETAQATGRLVTGAVRAGEVITDVRLLGPGLLAGYPPTGGVGGEVVAMPVRLTDAAVTRLLAAGDVVDVLAATLDDLTAAQPGPAALVARAVPVLAVPSDDGATDYSQGAVVVLATDAATAADLAGAAAVAGLTVAIRPR